MCELEQHVMMLRESGGPLSPSRILSHIRSINCQIGDGSQEDAHEFLRSVASHDLSLWAYSLWWIDLCLRKDRKFMLHAVFLFSSFSHCIF